MQQSSNSNRSPRLGGMVALALLGLGALPIRSEAGTVKFFAWENPTEECADQGEANRTPYNHNVKGWHDELVAKGWPSGGYLIDGAINLERFCDDDTDTAGSSFDRCTDKSNGVDEADAVFLAIHGADDDDHWIGFMRYHGVNASCFANRYGDFHVGDYDTEFLHFYSCHSLDDDNLPGAWEMMVDEVDTASNGRRAHLMTGFHGNATTFSTESRYKKLAKDGWSSSIRDAWMDHMYRWTYLNEEFTWGSQCPVAYAIGSSEADCEDRLLNDRYPLDNPDPSSAVHYCYSYYEDCDPHDETAFNPPED